MPEPRGERLAQGDIIEAVEFFRPKSGGYRDTLTLHGVIVSHSCDYTKFEADETGGRPNLDRFPLLVTAIARESSIPDQGTRGHAAAGRMARYFHLPAEAPLADGDHFVDFWWIQPVAVHELLASKRVGSMTDLWQRRLQVALDRFFSWEDRKKPVPADP